MVSHPAAAHMTTKWSDHIRTQFYILNFIRWFFFTSNMYKNLTFFCIVRIWIKVLRIFLEEKCVHNLHKIKIIFSFRECLSGILFLFLGYKLKFYFVVKGEMNSFCCKCMNFSICNKLQICSPINRDFCGFYFYRLQALLMFLLLPAHAKRHFTRMRNVDHFTNSVPFWTTKQGISAYKGFVLHSNKKKTIWK